MFLAALVTHHMQSVQPDQHVVIDAVQSPGDRAVFEESLAHLRQQSLAPFPVEGHAKADSRSR